MRRRPIFTMLYKQFLEIADKLNPEFVANFDYWLATLPTNCQENITASVVSRNMGVSYSQAEAILRYAEKKCILEKYYLVTCPNDECGSYLAVISKDEIASILTEPQYCEECDEYKQITLEDIFVAYRVILQPDVSEDEISKEIEKRLKQGEETIINFCEADSLLNDKTTIYESFYNPSESAYAKFKELREKLDLDYGKNSTAKGKALEVLVLAIFNEIKGIKVTNDVKTETNQFDCTCLSSVHTLFPSIFNYLYPYFIIECKNEPDKKPNNTYCNKLLSIMSVNEAQIGIIVGRADATSTCFTIAREHYLRQSQLNKQQIILTFSDNDLKLLIDEKVNILEYLDFKIFQVTSNSPNAKYEMFEE